MAAPFEVFKDSQAERKFHEKRFEEKAAEHNQIREKRIIFKGKPKTAVDFAHKEALIENEDFDRRQTAEYKKWEERLKVIIGHILEKRDDLEGEGKKHKIALLILGGGVRGSYGMGQLIGLNELHMDSSSGVFDVVVGVSAGAASGASYLGGPEQSKIGATIFMEECTQPEFVDFRRAKNGTIMNADFLAETVRSGPKAIDTEKILTSPTKFFVAAHNQNTNKVDLIDVKTARPDMVAPLHAAISIGVWPLYHRANRVNEHEYNDAAFDPMPLQQILEKFKPTDILVLPNSPFEGADGFTLKNGLFFLGGLIPKIGSLGIMKKMLRHRIEMRKALETFEKDSGVNIGFMWPEDTGLGSLTQNTRDIESAIQTARKGTLTAFNIQKGT